MTRAWRALRRFWESDPGLSVFLGLLVGFLFVLPPLDEPDGSGRGLVVDTGLSVLLLAGVAAVSTHAAVRAALFVLVVTALVVRWGPFSPPATAVAALDFQTTVLCATASMAILMGEEIQKRGLRGKIALKKVIMGSERSSDAMRSKMKELLGVEHVFDIPGLTELYGPGTGLDCTYHEGIHYWADYYIVELLNPETLEPVPP